MESMKSGDLVSVGFVSVQKVFTTAFFLFLYTLLTTLTRSFTMLYISILKATGT